MEHSNLNQVLLHDNSRVGIDLEAWLAHGGGEGLEIALEDPAAIIPLIKEAGLRGLGGSGFPTHIKWDAVSGKKHCREKFLICNGNEDEPGTFKDRILLEETPHQVIEGAIIAAVATGVNRIFFYINPELKKAIVNIGEAVEQWKKSDKVSDKIKSQFPFPRRKPPFPADNGVHGCPTLIDNIETLCNVPHIVRTGADWYRNLGIGDACGTKIYSLSGDVLSPGVYELPMGTPLSELINIYGGGMLVNKKFKAVFTGGPSNTLLTPKDLDVPLDFDSVAARRSSLGTGAMIVVSEGTGIVKRVAEYVSFFAHSSCGQCPSCKTGTYYIAMLLNKIDMGLGRRADLDALINLCDILPGSGRCPLINGAVKVLDSSLYHFMGEYEKSLRG
jgi:NADH-quinone oxidoreductase subunit F